jgi:hypothetical protein
MKTSASRVLVGATPASPLPSSFAGSVEGRRRRRPYNDDHARSVETA